jgi:1-acyl-sn-glycerol-3-phosphate acyltransferase
MLIKYLRLFGAFADAFAILWLKFPRATREQKLAHIQAWSRHVLDLMDVQLNIDPTVNCISTTNTQLLVSNHVSWLDVLVIQSLRPSVFVAKSEVRDWPLVGRLTQACGVVFVDRRSSSSARRMVDDVSNALHQGDCVASFPEGTSSEGHGVCVFHANLFEAAIRGEIEVLPLALRYTEMNTRALCLKAAFVGELSFIKSLHQVISTTKINVHVKIGESISPNGHSRRTLAHLSHRSVSHQLEFLQR